MGEAQWHWAMAIREGLFEKGAFKPRQEFKMSQPFESEGTNIPDWGKNTWKAWVTKEFGTVIARRVSPDGDGDVKLGFLAHGLQGGFALESGCRGAIEGYIAEECHALLCILNISLLASMENGPQRGRGEGRPFWQRFLQARTPAMVTWIGRWQQRRQTGKDGAVLGWDTQQDLVMNCILREGDGEKWGGRASMTPGSFPRFFLFALPLSSVLSSQEKWEWACEIVALIGQCQMQWSRILWRASATSGPGYRMLTRREWITHPKLS